MLTDRDDAETRLERMIQSSLEPTITSGEIDALLDENVLASVWAAETEYELGAVVVPTSGNRNGHRFRLVDFDGEGIESGETEPSWPRVTDGRITDGNLVWREDGPEPLALWDLRQAAYEGWMLKYAKVAHQYSFETERQVFKIDEKLAHFERMANKYLPVGVA